MTAETAIEGTRAAPFRGTQAAAGAPVPRTVLSGADADRRVRRLDAPARRRSSGTAQSNSKYGGSRVPGRTAQHATKPTARASQGPDGVVVEVPGERHLAQCQLRSDGGGDCARSWRAASIGRPPRGAAGAPARRLHPRVLRRRAPGSATDVLDLAAASSTVGERRAQRSGQPALATSRSARRGNARRPAAAGAGSSTGCAQFVGGGRPARRAGASSAARSVSPGRAAGRAGRRSRVR